MVAPAREKYQYFCFYGRYKAVLMTGKFAVEILGFLW